MHGAIASRLKSCTIDFGQTGTPTPLGRSATEALPSTAADIFDGFLGLEGRLVEKTLPPLFLTRQAATWLLTKLRTVSLPVWQASQLHAGEGGKGGPHAV